MNKILIVLFFVLLFTPERIFNFKNFIDGRILGILHGVFCGIWLCGVFYEAFKKNKLIYNKKQICFVVVFLVLYIAYNVIALYPSNIETLLYRFKNLLFVLLFPGLSQFFQLVNIRKLYKPFLYLFFFFSGFRLLSSYFLCKSINMPCNVNYFACFFVFCCCFIVIKHENFDKIYARYCLWFVMILIMYYLYRRYSFFVSLFVVPFVFFKKWHLLVAYCCPIAICIAIANNKTDNRLGVLLRNFPYNLWEKYEVGYIKQTSLKLFLQKFGFYKTTENKTTEKILKKRGLHNFYVLILSHFCIVDILLLAYCLFKNFNREVFILLAVYSWMITMPLYFFVALSFCIFKKDQLSCNHNCSVRF